MCVLFIPLLFACLRLRISSKSRSIAGVLFIRPGASRVPYYYAQLVCVPDVTGLLTVCQHNKTKNQKTLVCVPDVIGLPAVWWHNKPKTKRYRISNSGPQVLNKQTHHFISWSIAGVPSSQALPGYLITSPPSMCVPEVIGAQTVWIQKQNKKTSKQHSTT